MWQTVLSRLYCIVLSFHEWWVTKPYYLQGSIKAQVRKPYVRGYIHKIGLLTAPIWLYMSYPVQFSFCRAAVWMSGPGAFFAMFYTSTIFHHRSHNSSAELEWWRTLDTLTVAGACIANIVPALLYYELHRCLISYFILTFAVAPLIIEMPRIGAVTGICLAFVVTLFGTLPAIIAVTPHFYICPLLSHFVCFSVGLLLYLFPDNDINPTGTRLIVGSHDLIHLLSVAFFLNFVYFNHLLLQHNLCY